MTMLHFITTVAVFIPIASSLTDTSFLKTQINDERHAVEFNRLLNTITKVNQERMDNLKKMTKLQALNPYPEFEDSLRSDLKREDDSDSSDSSEEDVIYLVIPDTTKDTTLPKDRREAAPSAQPTADFKFDLKRSRPDILEARIRPNISQPLKQPFTNVTVSQEGFEYLRQSIERSCKSREVKKCKRACKEAVSNSCAQYDCRKKLKKHLKKSCKRSCKDEFKGGW